MKRVIHFEIHASDPVRAAKFYTDVFGWKIKKYEGGWDGMDYWLIDTGSKDQPGIGGGLQRRSGKVENGSPSAFVCIVDVPSIDDAVSKVPKSWGTVTEPKMNIPKVWWLAYCKDTEGNLFGILEPSMDSGM